MEADQWLCDIVIINESREEGIAGDIAVYRSVGEACRAVEPWWVEGREGYAFTASGDRLIFGVDAFNRVVVNGRERCAEGPQVVERWLNAHAASVLEARKHRAQKGTDILGRCEEQGLLPKSVTALIAYSGFSR